MAETSDDELLQIDNCLDTLAIKMTSASDFQRLQNAISNNLNKLNNNTNDLEKLVQKLGTSEDSEPLRDRYLRLQNDAKSLMQLINNDLKQFPEASKGTEDQRKKRSLVDNYSKQYLAVMNRFQEAQRIGAKKEKESLERARAVTYRQPGIHGSEFDDNVTSSSYQRQQQVVLPMEQEIDINGLKERDDQLRQLETNIVQVNELFKDVARLVHEHGDIIDNIEDHTVETQKHVETANKQLATAVVYQSAARRKKIILLAILVIIIIIVALSLLIYFTTKK